MQLLDKNSEEYKRTCSINYKPPANSRSRRDIAASFPKSATRNAWICHGCYEFSKIVSSVGRKELENYYLIIAAITDTELAVKENEALLSLAINLSEKGDIERAYEYIRIALDDAPFITRFKNSCNCKSAAYY